MVIKVSKSNSESYSYFLEKSSAVIYKLLIGPGDAKSRLRDVEFDLTFILSFELPKEYLNLKAEIRRHLFIKRQDEIDGKVLNTSYKKSISTIRNSTASKIIEKIHLLHCQVSCYQSEIRRNKNVHNSSLDAFTI